jgi:hypothetical protein
MAAVAMQDHEVPFAAHQVTMTSLDIVFSTLVQLRPGAAFRIVDTGCASPQKYYSLRLRILGQWRANNVDPFGKVCGQAVWLCLPCGVFQHTCGR